MKSEFILHGSRGSGSAAIEAALEWTGAPYRIVSGATWEPGPGFEALQSTNSLAQVPTLLLPADECAPGEGPQVLTESAAILIHLGLAYPASGLLSGDARRRARTLRGLVYVAANCYAAIGIVDYPERWLPPPARKPARERLREGARARLHALWDGFADEFMGTPAPYLGGDAPDALDLLAAVVSKWSGARAHLRSSRPDLAALLRRVDQHPRVAPVFTRHWPQKG